MYQVPIDISPTDLHVDSDNCTLHTLMFLPGIESGISAWNVRSWNQLLEPQEEGHLLAEADKEKKLSVRPKIVVLLKTVAAIKTVFGTPWEKSRDMMLMNNHEYSGKNPPCQK